MEAALHPLVQQRMAQEAPKLRKVMDVVEEQFGTMRNFLKSWYENDETSTSKKKFFKGGAQEIVGVWLQAMEPTEVPGVVEMASKLCEMEVKVLVKDQDSILRNARKSNNAVVDASSPAQTLPSSLDEMQQLVRTSASTLWAVLSRIATETDLPSMKKGRDMMLFLSIMILLYARNQQVNAFQTQIGVFLKACHLTSTGIDIVQGTGICSGERHVQNTMKKVGILMFLIYFLG